MDIGSWMFIIVGSCAIIGFFVLCIYIGIANSKENQNKNQTGKYEIVENFTKTEQYAKVVNQYCASVSKGTKIPKTVNQFYICFECENKDTLALPVNEEMYLDIDVGMQGKLTLVDGNLYSFEPDNI